MQQQMPVSMHNAEHDEEFNQSNTGSHTGNAADMAAYAQANNLSNNGDSHQNLNHRQSQNLSSQMKSPNFFKLSGIPKFGKNWLDNFIDDEDMQNTFLTSEVVRNVVMLQCVFYASVYNDLLLYKQAYLMQKDTNGSEHHVQDTNQINDQSNHQTSSFDMIQKKQSTTNNNGIATQNQSQSMDNVNELPAFKVGIIGCGHIGTMILTKLLEIAGSFNNLKVMVSTRQPHLLRPFQQEFQVDADFNNERIVAECDLIFLCILPQQANQVLKEIRAMTLDRQARASKNKNVSKPLFVSCMAAIGIQKLKLLLAEEATFIRTHINVMHIKEYLIQQSQPQLIEMISQKAQPADMQQQQPSISKQMIDTAESAQQSLQKHYQQQDGNSNTKSLSNNDEDPTLRESASAAMIQAIANRQNNDDNLSRINDQQQNSISYNQNSTHDRKQSQMNADDQMEQESNHLISHNGSIVKRGSKLAKVLSHKALKIGMESGVTAEYIVRQTCEQLVQKLADLFVLFDTFQESLYSNDPVVQNTQNNNQENILENNKVMYEESILMTLLGPDYMQFISEETGEWNNERDVLEKFYDLFDTRIRYIFDADADDDEGTGSQQNLQSSTLQEDHNQQMNQDDNHI